MKIVALVLLTAISSTISMAQTNDQEWLNKLLREKASPFLLSVLDQPDTFRYQLIYTSIDRDKKNVPSLKDYYLNVDPHRYFNPASTVKMPLAFLALEKLNQLKISGLDKNTSMLTDSAFTSQTNITEDTSSRNGMPSIAHYIKKVFLVSDNEAYNRLYEFIGQQTINERLHEMGYGDSRITRRFVRMTEEENRHTNPIRFLNGDKLIYQQPPATSNFQFDFSKQELMGRAHYNRDDSLIQSPMDFTKHNKITLPDLHWMLRSVIFPKSVPAPQRFQLDESDYRFLYEYMSKLPSESSYPNYDTSEFFDSYTKFFFFRAGKSKIPPNIRSFNKTGWSYGFLTDVCYIIDFEHGIEFMLSGNIYVNKDGILNDDKYEYEETGYPFFKEVGEIIYQYELERKRKHKPRLDLFKLDYKAD